MAEKPSQPTFPLTASTFNKFRPGRIFKDAVETEAPGSSSASSKPMNGSYPRQITGMSFDDHGHTVITAGEDESFRLYNCKTGKHVKTLYSKKYGIDLPRFTHKETTILHISTKENDIIRYHSLHDNKYLRYFEGHTRRVLSLDVSPVDDGFISGSEDKTVKLWDLRTPKPRGELNLPASALAAYDANGIIFAVALNNYQRINLYDTKNFDKEPFLHIVLEDPSLNKISFPPRRPVMTSLAFSANGKYLLVGTAGDAHYVLDAFEGTLLYKLEGFIGLERGKTGTHVGMVPERGISGSEVCWTPDSKFICGGSQDGRVHIWDLSDPENLPSPSPPGTDPAVLTPVFSLEGHPGASRCVRFNPRFMMVVTAGSELAFWLPDQGNSDGDITKLDKGKAPEA